MVTNPLYEGPVYETIDDVLSALPPTPCPPTPPAAKEPPYVSLFPTYANSDVAEVTTVPEGVLPPEEAVGDDSYTVMRSAGPVVTYSKVKKVQRPTAVNSSEENQQKYDAIQSKCTEC